MMQSNWNLIKKVERMLEVASQTPEDAMKSYAGELNAAHVGLRQVQLESKLKSTGANVASLSKQLAEQYGITPEEMVAGGSPKGFGAKMKFWMRRLTGSQQLMDKWREARAEEDEIIEELRSKSGQGGRMPTPSGRAAVARGRANEGAEVARIEGRQAARDVREASREGALPVYGSELEAEYLGNTDEEMAKQSEEAVESDFAKQTKARIKEQALSKKQQEAKKAQEVDERINRSTIGKLPTARRGSDIRLATTKEIAERLKLEQLSNGELPGEEAEALKAEIGTEFAIVRRKNQKAEAPEMTPAEVEAKVQAERGRLGWEPSSEFPDREATIPPPPAEAAPIELTRKKTKKQENVPPPPAELVRALADRESGMQELDIDRAVQILPNAPQLWDLAYKNMTNGAAQNIDKLEFSKVMQGKNENGATKFVYVLARYADAKKNGASDEQLALLYSNAEKAAAMLKLNNDPTVKSVLGKKEFGSAKKAERTKSKLELVKEKPTQKRPPSQLAA